MINSVVIGFFKHHSFMERSSLLQAAAHSRYSVALDSM